MGVVGAETIALNTEAQHLAITKADKKLLIGQQITKFRGAGGNPEIGEHAAKESAEEIKKLLDGAELVYITCGLGGGTGTGSAPVVAEIAKSLGALTIAVVTLPFSVEGKKRKENALYGFSKLQKNVDLLIVIPNDKLLEVAPNLPINQAFKVADELLANAIKETTEMVTKPGLINVDFADLRSIIENGGIGFIGVGEAEKETHVEGRALKAVEQALSCPLLDTDISQADRALVSVTVGPEVTLTEFNAIIECINQRIKEDSNIISGLRIDDSLPKNMIRILVVLAGVSVPNPEEIMGLNKNTFQIDRI